MVLTAAEMGLQNIIQGVQPGGTRDTTYDATVGEIISGGEIVSNSSFTLKSRGVVWVVSNENFQIPSDITGLVTLRTTWAHEGVFALNVGVLDPGWHGPVATALVNFGRDPFVIRKNEPFFRVLFLQSQATGAPVLHKNRAAYVRDVTSKSRAFSDTFLNMSTLVDEVGREILKLPYWAYILGGLAILVSLIAIYAPIAITVWTDHLKNQAVVTTYERRLQSVEDQLNQRKMDGERPLTANVDPNLPSKNQPAKTRVNPSKEAHQIRQ